MTTVTPAPSTASTTRPAQAAPTVTPEQAALTITVLRRARTTELRLDGELDATTSPLLDCLVTDALSRGRDSLSLDLTATSFCDVTGLNRLLAARRLVQGRGGRLTLVGTAPLLRHLLRVSGAGDVVESDG